MSACRELFKYSLEISVELNVELFELFWSSMVIFKYFHFAHLFLFLLPHYSIGTTDQYNGSKEAFFSLKKRKWIYI